MIRRVFQKPSLYWFWGIFIGYLVLNFFVSGFYKTLPLLGIYAETVHWFPLVLSILLSILIGFLTSLSAVLAFILYADRRACAQGKFLTSVGAVGGLATGFCPLCVAGLFPLLFQVFGITFSFASFPFHGIEVQLFVVALLGAGLFFLTRSVRPRNSIKFK